MVVSRVHFVAALFTTMFFLPILINHLPWATIISYICPYTLQHCLYYKQPKWNSFILAWILVACDHKYPIVILHCCIQLIWKKFYCCLAFSTYFKYTMVISNALSSFSAMALLVISSLAFYLYDRHHKDVNEGGPGHKIISFTTKSDTIHMFLKMH